MINTERENRIPAVAERSFKRFWQLGMLAKDMFQTRWRRSPEAVARAQRRLIARLGDMHGLPQKIGQILSLTELSAEAGEGRIYTPLTEYRPAMSDPDAFSEMERSLGRPLSECFQSIEGRGISASLSQVHSAILPDGRKAAVKLQLPGIGDALLTDLRALGWLTNPMGGLNRGFDLKAYQREVGEKLKEELDYRHEARMIHEFSILTSDWEEVRVPEVVESLSGDRILTMTWIEGVSFDAAVKWPLEDRREAAGILLRLFLSSCFRWGCLHADPHPGNYRFSKQDGRVTVGLLDFGCVKRLEPKVVDGLTGLIRDLEAGSGPDISERMMGRLLQMGFNQDLLLPMADRLGPLFRVLLEPYLTPGPFDLTSWRLQDRAAEVLGPYRSNFRMAGPAGLIFFMRAYQGVIQYLKALGVPVDWKAALDDILGNRESGAVPDPIREMIEKARGEFEGSGKLRVQVIAKDEVRVDLTFRAAAAGHLTDLIPDDIRPKLECRSIDLVKISEDAAARNFAPGNLFEFIEEHRTIRVWLE